MFNRVRPAGHWVDLTTVHGSELEQFDQQFLAAVDGDGGGRWDPEQPIVIGGGGVEVAAGGFRVSGGAMLVGVPAAFASMNVVGQSTVGGSLLVQGDGITCNNVTATGQATFGGDVTFNGGVIANAGFVGLFGHVNDFSSTAFNGGNGSGHFDGPLSVGGNTSLSGTLSLSGQATLAGKADIGGDCVVAGDTFLAGLVVLAGQGRVKWRLRVAVDEDLLDIDPFNTDVVAILFGPVLTTNRTWKIGHLGATDGLRMSISRANETSAHSIFVRRSDDSLIVELTNLGVQSAELICWSGVWFLLHAFN